ncbi:MAG: ABC transporter substrate-binding protein [Desulfobacterales bacterium]
MGRTVTLPDNPQRIVAMAPSITEIIFALGQEHRLKGVTRFSDFPQGALLLPKVGSYVHLDLERIVALKPDLCLAVKDGNPIEVIQRLESLKIPVYAVNPKNFTSVMQTIVKIGELLHTAGKANRLVGSMNDRIQRVKSLVAKTTHRPKVFFQIGINPIVAVGTDTYNHELIVLAGGKNLSEGPILYPRFSREQILGLSPDIFIITSMAREKVFDEIKADWAKWPDIPAVRNDRIFVVDSNLFDRPSPRLVDGLEVLVKLIHPELFEEKR